VSPDPELGRDSLIGNTSRSLLIVFSWARDGEPSPGKGTERRRVLMSGGGEEAQNLSKSSQPRTCLA